MMAAKQQQSSKRPVELMGTITSNDLRYGWEPDRNITEPSYQTIWNSHRNALKHGNLAELPVPEETDNTVGKET